MMIAFLAAKYSHAILRFLRHPRGFEADAKLIGITVGGFAIIGLLVVSWRRLTIYFSRNKAE